MTSPDLWVEIVNAVQALFEHRMDHLETVFVVTGEERLKAILSKGNHDIVTLASGKNVSDQNRVGIRHVAGSDKDPGRQTRVLLD